jgi:hypothetical protein
MTYKQLPLVITPKGKLIDGEDIRMTWKEKIRRAIQDLEDKALRAFLEQADEK